MPIDFYGKSGGTWRKVDPAKGLHYKNGSSWQEVDEAYYKSSGSWEKVYQKSDPVTLTFNPVSMDSWRPSSWRGSSNLRIGSYDFGDHWLLMDFTTATDTGGTGDTLADALDIRPVVKSASLTLRRTTGGFGTINSGTYYISWNNGGYTTGTPTNESTGRTTHSLSSAGWVQNSTRQMTIDDFDLIPKLEDYTLCVANNLSPVYPGGQDSDYTNVDSTTTTHTLTVELDYS
jgi:hypothetical protein